MLYFQHLSLQFTKITLSNSNHIYIYYCLHAREFSSFFPFAFEPCECLDSEKYKNNMIVVKQDLEYININTSILLLFDSKSCKTFPNKCKQQYVRLLRTNLNL